MDAELRALHADSKRTGSPEDAAAYLRAARRAGSITDVELERAAWVGHEGARLALGPSAPTVPTDVGEWARGLERFGLPTVLLTAASVARAVVVVAGGDLADSLREACLAALSTALALQEGSATGDQLLAALEPVRRGRPATLRERGLTAYWCAFHASEAPLLGGGRAAVHVASQAITCAVELLTFDEIVQLAREAVLEGRWPGSG